MKFNVPEEVILSLVKSKKVINTSSMNVINIEIKKPKQFVIH